MKTYPLEEKTITLNGKFWIGDPCYIFPDTEWQELCNLMFPNDSNEADFNDSETVRVVEIEGETCYLFGTAYGDGVYPLVVDGKMVDELGVDAGMLSVIPMNLVRKRSNGWSKSKQFGVNNFTIDVKDAKISVKNGDFTLGDIKIYTSEKAERYVLI